jgi:hypothetical protein
MRAPLLLLLLIGVLAVPGVAAAQAGPKPPAIHPIVGKWTWTRSENNCTEVYEFLPDGTLKVQSGDERSDNSYAIAREPDANGFYEVKMKVMKDYGGKDCGDATDDSTGDEYVNYFLFDPSKARYIVCARPAFEACFGPLRKIE